MKHWLFRLTFGRELPVHQLSLVSSWLTAGLGMCRLLKSCEQTSSSKYIHTHTHRDIHRDTHTYRHTQRHTHIDTHRDIHTDTYTYRHTHRDTHRHTQTQIQTHTETHIQTHTHTHTYTHTLYWFCFSGDLWPIERSTGPQQKSPPSLIAQGSGFSLPCAPLPPLERGTLQSPLSP